MMSMVKKTLVGVLGIVVVSLGLLGCAGMREHPSDEHPSEEHPSSEHPAAEHPSAEHPE